MVDPVITGEYVDLTDQSELALFEVQINEARFE